MCIDIKLKEPPDNNTNTNAIPFRALAIRFDRLSARCVKPVKK